MKAQYFLNLKRQIKWVIILITAGCFLGVVGCKDRNNTYTPRKKVKITQGANPPEEFIESLQEQGISYKNKSTVENRVFTQTHKSSYYETVDEIEGIYKSNLDYSKEYAKVKALEYAHSSKNIAYAGICNNAMIIVGTNGVVKEMSLSTSEDSSDDDETFTSNDNGPKIFHESTRYH
jgi:hypothetical protein